MKTPNLKGPRLFKWLVENKTILIEAKKSATKYADSSIVDFSLTTTTKAKILYENDTEKGVLKRTIIANTYNWLDSHLDVHLPGIFSKSIQERGTRIPHLHDHHFELSARIGRPISFAEVGIKWRALGYPKNGNTMALQMESQIEKEFNPSVFREYLADQIDQHSVGMQYVKMDLAVNDDNYNNEFKTWSEVFPQIGNKDQAEEAGYFWAVREAKLIEVSAVLLGSNVLTPTLLNDKSQSVESTEKQKVNLNELLNHYQPEIWMKKN